MTEYEALDNIRIMRKIAVSKVFIQVFVKATEKHSQIHKDSERLSHRYDFWKIINHMSSDSFWNEKNTYYKKLTNNNSVNFKFHIGLKTDKLVERQC